MGERDADGGRGLSPALEVVGLRKAFGGVAAVDGVDLQVQRGEFLTLLGPSGCGKTTLMRLVAGFDTATAGSISVDGVDVTRQPPYRRPLGMMFQDLALFPHLSVGENVGFGLRVRKLRGEAMRLAVGAALDQVGLGDLAGRSVHQLSGGQRQRVALARALAVKPAVLLLDEPLSALDLKLRRHMQMELKQLQRRLGTTFVFVTHDQEEALSMSDRIAVMNQGKVEQLGTAKEIYDAPRTGFVARFVGDTNYLEAEVVERGAGHCTMRLPGLGVVRRLERAGPAGSAAALTVRPEEVTLRTGGGVLEGVVSGQSYLGSAMRYLVVVRGQTLIASLPCRVGEAAPFGPGDAVCVDWDDARAVIVEE